MENSSTTRLGIVLATIVLCLALLFVPGWGTARNVSAQVPAAETTVTEQATATLTSTPTNTPIPTDTPTPTNTPPGPTNTPTRIATLPPDTPTTVPSSGPVPIPEPVTVVLFGTGLAALSAAVASRRKNEK